MARLALVAIALATLIGSTHCAGGGPSGTNFATATGNLVNAEIASGVEGVRVSVEGTEFEGATDATGSFLVRGDFAGPVTLVFRRDADGFSARIGIDVPKGGTVTLHNVSCSGASGRCEAEDVDVDEPSDDDASEPSIEDPSDPSVPSPDEEVSEPNEDDDEGPGSVGEPSAEEDEAGSSGPGGEPEEPSED